MKYILSLFLILSLMPITVMAVANSASSTATVETTSAWTELSGSNISLITSPGTTIVTLSLDARVNYTGSTLYARIKRDGEVMQTYNVTSDSSLKTSTVSVGVPDVDGTHYYVAEVSSTAGRKGIIYRWSFSAVNGNNTETVAQNNTETHIARNAFYNASGWFRVNDSISANILTIASNGSFQYKYAPAGTGQISFSIQSLLDSIGNLTNSGRLSPGDGISFNHSFPNHSLSYAAFGNWLAFGDPGVSEDYIGYKANTFYFRDSPGGMDETDPNLDLGNGTIYNNGVAHILGGTNTSVVNNANGTVTINTAIDSGTIPNPRLGTDITTRQTGIIMEAYEGETIALGLWPYGLDVPINATLNQIIIRATSVGDLTLRLYDNTYSDCISTNGTMIGEYTKTNLIFQQSISYSISSGKCIGFNVITNTGITNASIALKYVVT